MNRSIKPIRVVGNIAIVPLTRGYEAVIDAEDVPLVEKCSWSAKEKTRKDGAVSIVYAKARINGKKISMQRLILGLLDSDVLADHIDRDGLNNRKKNLRPVTGSQNQMNRKININSSSGYKGVYFDKTKRRWRARITKDKIVTALGYFDTAEKAFAAYARASAELHGEYGRLR